MDPSLGARKPYQRSPDDFDPWGVLIPRIPCAACGRRLRYTEAAILTLPDGGFGWGHTPGTCNRHEVQERPTQR